MHPFLNCEYIPDHNALLHANFKFSVYLKKQLISFYSYFLIGDFLQVFSNWL